MIAEADTSTADLLARRVIVGRSSSEEAVVWQGLASKLEV